MARPDLHMHSTASDGVLTPRQLVQGCLDAGIDLMAITDHDTFDGVDSLRGADLPLTLIPGVELSVSDMPGLHLLAYGCREANELREAVKQLGIRREERARFMLEKLSSLGMPLDWNEIRSRYTGSIGRPHIARAMVRAGYVRSMQEAFEKYIGHHGPAYIESSRLSMAEALELVRENGFVPVLAHPYELRLEDHMLWPLLEKWTSMGLQGVEVYHPSAFSKGFDTLKSMAERLGLLVTGGSDFHQSNDEHGRLGCTLPCWAGHEADAEAFLRAVRAPLSCLHPGK